MIARLRPLIAGLLVLGGLFTGPSPAAEGSIVAQAPTATGVAVAQQPPVPTIPPPPAAAADPAHSRREPARADADPGAHTAGPCRAGAARRRPSADRRRPGVVPACATRRGVPTALVMLLTGSAAVLGRLLLFRRSRTP